MTNSNAQPPGSCVFCRRHGLTNEDALPLWVSRTLLPPGSKVRVFDWQRMGDRAPSITTWRDKAFKRPVRVVCGNCNHGWMERLESRARIYLRPMIRGTTLSLSPDAQKTVATWSTKTAFMLHYAQTPPTNLPWPLLNHLRLRGEPPPGTHVWLGAYTGDSRAQYDLKHATVDLPPGPSRAPSGNLVTLSLERLLVHLAFSPGKDGRGFPTDLPADVKPFLIKIWPPTPLVVVWPPDRALTQRGLDVLARGLPE